MVATGIFTQDYYDYEEPDPNFWVIGLMPDPEWGEDTMFEEDDLQGALEEARWKADREHHSYGVWWNGIDLHFIAVAERDEPYYTRPF